MRRAALVRLSVIVLAALAVLTIGVRSVIRVEAAVPPAAVALAPISQLGGMGGLDMVEPGREPAARVYVSAPVTAEAARTWSKLQQKVSMPFANETPLEDVLKYIETATQDEGKPNSGIPIYVDPIGLQEAEKSLQTPITLNLEGMPLSTTLTLMLRQLGLEYTVQKDGLLVIGNEHDADSLGDPSALILERLDRLQAEVTALRKEVSILRGARGMGGGMGGQAPRTGGGFQ